MHMEQLFVDNLDAYVWIYDPIPFYYWVIGTFIVFGGIGICLFPLWPPQVRYVYSTLVPNTHVTHKSIQFIITNIFSIVFNKEVIY